MRSVGRERNVACERKGFAQLRNLASVNSRRCQQQLPLPSTELAETRMDGQVPVEGNVGKASDSCRISGTVLYNSQIYEARAYSRTVAQQLQ